ncbi:uncharacterized protein LOC129607374 [Condylostylus longicornis]|uniref:uncharacterized protein LOC129607374 n=1 Tax=Condylostylus longicornis TaxID=2530218 RepID=UPI00244DCD0F|nr:uncharacterized protein LOC129607374 [Condylostylus longicornis]
MNVLNLINELPKLLRDSHSDQKYIFLFRELENDKIKCYSYAARAISVVCQDIEKNPKFDEVSLQRYTDFILEITKYVSNKKYEKFMLQNIKYFVYFLLNVGAEEQLKNYFKNFVIGEICCEDSYKFYFEIVKNCQFYLLQKDVKLQLKFDYCQEICFQNLQRCMEVPDEDQFLNFLTELLNHESSFNTLSKCQDDANNLILFCISKLKNFSNIVNLEDFFILITKIFLNFNKYEILSESKILWSVELMKNIVQNKTIKKNSYHHYALTLVLYISSLRTKEFSQLNLKDILRKQLKLFENNQNATWYYDIQWTFTELFTRNSKFILKNIEEENLRILIEILYRNIKPTTIITSYSKQNCSLCKNYQSHQILNMFQILVEIYEHMVQFENDSEKGISLIQYIMSSIKKSYINISQCKSMYAIFAKTLSYFKKLIAKVKTIKMAKVSIEFLHVMNCGAFIQNIQDKIINARLYLHLYTILNEKLKILELYAVILNLSPKNSENINSYMVSFVKLLIELNMTTVTIKEVSQNCLGKFLDNENVDENSFNFLIKKQLVVITTFKLFTMDKIENLLEKIIDEDILTQLDFVIIVRNLEQLIKSKKVHDKLESIRIIEEKSSMNDLRKYLILAHLYKYDALRKFEKCKNIYSFKISTEEDLTEINIKDFNKINLNKECENIEPAILSLRYFKNIFNIFDEECRKTIDIDAILDDLSYLARHFQFRGYLDLATDAWFLVLNFAKHYNNCDLYKMRALTFFCKYIHYDILEKYDLSLEDELHSLSEKVLENYKNLETLSPRKQNYVLLYLLNVAYYYGHQNDIKSLKVLIKMVQSKLNEIKERKYKFELVRAHLVSLELYFRINTLEKLVVSPFIFISHILRELKEVVYITSEDSLSMSCFLIELLQNLTSFLLTIFETKMIMSYLIYVLSFSLQYGITLRITQLFLIWTKISLQNGDVNPALLKLLILEKLILESEADNVPIDKYFNEAIETTKNVNGLRSMQILVGEQTVEETRKAVQKISLSEKPLVFFQELQHKDFLKYLIKHNKSCMCNICKFPVYKFFIFEIGSSYMKLNILGKKDRLMISLFLEKSLEWFSKIDDTCIKRMFEETVFHLYVDNIMWFRSNEKYSEALDYCELASKFLERIRNNHNNRIWKVVEHYCALQSNSSVSETNVLKSPTGKKNIRCKSRKI